MSDKVYILMEGYHNDEHYEDFYGYSDRFVGVFSTEEEAIIAARKKAITKLGHSLDSLTSSEGYFADYDEWRDENDSYFISFNQSGYGDFTHHYGSYTYEILPTCINAEPEPYEPKVNIDIQPSYESIKTAEAAFNNLADEYDSRYIQCDISEIEKDFSEEFIREQNNLSNGKEV